MDKRLPVAGKTIRQEYTIMEEELVSKSDRKRIFINFSNHPSAEWEESQRKAEEKYGEIVDMEFPSVDPLRDENYIVEMADFYLEKILELDPEAVLCQGEFCLVYRLVSLLKANRITVLAACSRRMVEMKDGKKVASFQFSRFRPYL